MSSFGKWYLAGCNAGINDVVRKCLTAWFPVYFQGRIAQVLNCARRKTLKWCKDPTQALEKLSVKACLEFSSTNKYIENFIFFKCFELSNLISFYLE